ncbi:MAG: transketolase [Nitriliruptorales bacterium]|nr:transketolase [Nitriliruptorales bacterium]
MDAVEQANSGHPGTPMALAPLAYLLFTRHLVHDPGDTSWPDRDRFVLSAGHASMLQYSLLHLTGYDLSLDDLKEFRQLHSRTPGHPENFLTEGVEVTTGPLGQGFGNAVGLALAERLLAARFNRPGHEIVDHRTWVIASDGDLMEGVQAEAASLAGHLGLEKLIVFYDDNKVTLDGPAAMSFSEDVGTRYAAYGWRVLGVEDVNDLDTLDAGMKEAASPDSRPTLVRVRSVIGYGAPTKANSHKAHGSPLGADEVAGAKQALGWPFTDPFTVPEEVRRHMDQSERGAAASQDWQRRLVAYREACPDLAEEFERRMDGRLPEGWDEGLPSFDTGAQIATRRASGQVINAIAPRMPELISGSADLSSSNSSPITGAGAIERDAFSGRNVNYGVREHAMGAALNGMTAHGGLRPFGATFLVFTDYLRPAMRLSAIMSLPVVYVMTHDSIGLGEDGTTHQPVEHLAMSRATPNLHVLRPADAREVAGAWRHALARSEGPTLLALTRQNVPVLDGTDMDLVSRGAYVVAPEDSVNGEDDPDVVLLATGSEVHLAVEAVEILAEQDVTARAVSMPSWELFEDQDDDYLDDVLPEGVPVLSVEAASSFGWSRWADDHIAIDEFGVSAPAADLFEEFGFTPEAVAAAALELLEDSEERQERP